MINKIYYVSWSTWKEQQIDTPWDFWFISQGTRYKPKISCISKLKPSAAMIAHAFETNNTRLLEEIENNFINDIKLLAFIHAINPEHAQQQIMDIFEDAEFDKITVVDEQQHHTILKLIVSTIEKGTVS